MSPIHNLSIDYLHNAIQTAFEWTEEATRKSFETDPGAYFCNLLCAALGPDGLKVRYPPVKDFRQKVFEFEKPHIVRAESFFVTRRLIRNPAQISVLLQIWIDTPDLKIDFGIPICFAFTDREGHIDPLIWAEMRDIAKAVNTYSPATRFAVLGRLDTGYRGGSYHDQEAVHVFSSNFVAGTRLSPNRYLCPSLWTVSVDMACGWIGDAALSGRTETGIYDAFMSDLDVSNVVRVVLEPLDKPMAGRQPALPRSPLNKT